MQLFPLPSTKRADAEEIQAQAEILDAIPPLQRILNALPTMALVLNRERQVVLANQRLIEFAGATGIDELCGMRPGEVLRCIHAAETPAGCGSTEHCTVCGALQAIVTAQFGVAQTQVCRVLRRTAAGEEPLELEISACPVEVGGNQFLMVCASDIGNARCSMATADSPIPRAKSPRHIANGKNSNTSAKRARAMRLRWRKSAKTWNGA